MLRVTISLNRAIGMVSKGVFLCIPCTAFCLTPTMRRIQSVTRSKGSCVYPLLILNKGFDRLIMLSFRSAMSWRRLYALLIMLAVAACRTPVPPAQYGQSPESGDPTMPALEADPLNERTHALIATMLSRVSLTGKKVGVGEVLSHGGRSTPLGTYLAEQIDVALSRLRMASGFQIVERRWLKQVLEEYQLCQSGITEAACAKQLGTLVDADILLLGSLIDLGNRISLTVKLVETKTGFNLGAESIHIPKDSAITQLLIEPSIYPPPHTGPPSQEISPHAPEEPGRLQVRLWTERTVYRLGEDVRLHFVTNRNAYVTLVNVGTSGTVSILFPNRFFRSAFVRGGQQMTVPQDGAGFAFVLQGPPGTEIVRLVASEEPIEFTLTDLTATEGPVRSLGRTETATLTRDIATAKAERSREHWAEAVASFEVR